MTGAGADIWDASDQFMFVYRRLTGDGTIVTRVTGVQDTHDWAKAGIMMRESLAAESRHAFALVSAGRGVAFQRRVSTGGSTSHSGASGAAPAWVRLQRAGSTFTASYSTDGSSWRTLGSQTIGMSSTIYVGLAVTSHNASALARATFSSTTVDESAVQPAPGDGEDEVPAPGGGGNQDPTVSLTAPGSGSTFGAPATISLAATASDPDGRIARVDFYSGTTLIGSDSSAPYTLNWSKVPAGSYALAAVARDDDGGTTVSGTRTVTVRSMSTVGRAVFVPSADHDSGVDRYVVEFFAVGSSNAAAAADIGKPPVVGGEVQADVSATVASLPTGTYVATVTAIGPGGQARSEPSAQFTR